MTPKNAALLAWVGTIWMTVLLVWNFVFHLLNLLRGVEAPVCSSRHFIDAFGCLTVEPEAPVCPEGAQPIAHSRQWVLCFLTTGSVLQQAL
ncbi:MAG TPA: hypothetical protein VN946_21975 [Terriglobales bacterium]|jgi:hypothetical protein|nr:hypothetical protein [Terriglobales bacterium]